MRVAALQHDVAWEDRDATLAAVGPEVAAAAAAGAELVVLPEMFAVGFSMQTDVVAEPEGGPTSDWLRARAAEHGITICGSVPEVRPGATRPSNVLVLARPDGATERYAKLHPFQLGREGECYDAGTEVVQLDVAGLRVTPTICFDLRFAGLYWDAAPTTDCYLVVASWPAVRKAHWRALVIGRAIENQAWVVAVNRVGLDGGGYAHDGGSLIVDPNGEVVAEAGADPCRLEADVTAERVAEVRRKLPFVAGR